MNTPANGPQRPSAPRTPAPASTETPGTENEAHSGVQRHTASSITDAQLTELYDRIEAARALHTPIQHGPGVYCYCARCSGWDGRRFLGILTEHPCATLRALDGPPQPHTGPTEAPQDGPVAPSAPRHAPGGVSDPAPCPEPPDGRVECANCGREVENRAEPTMGWPSRDNWVHVPGAYTLCHPERGADSPRAEPRSCSAQRAETEPNKLA